MIYELVTDEAVPGKLPALNIHLEVAGTLFKKHGFWVLGFWTDEIGTGGQVTYVWIYESMEDREKGIASFVADPAWKRHVAEETEKEGVIIARVHNTMMALTPYSPEPRISTNVQELRIYDAMPGRLPDLHNRFANHTLGLFRKHGMENIGFWTETFGTSNRLVYMLGYPSLGDREKSWAAFSADPDWHKARDESEKNGTLTTKIYSRILRPTAYSPRSS